MLQTAFPKDLLVIDFETTDVISASAEPIEIGAILLDRQTLEEKDHFHSAIFNDLSAMDPKNIVAWDVPVETTKAAPKIEVVAKAFLDQFGYDVWLGSWVHKLDRAMLEKLLQSIGGDIERYDHHFFDLWPPAYVYLLKTGYTGSHHSEQMFQAFGMPPRTGHHNALQDCRFAADVLRQIME